jgi:hypothetical protein
MMRRRLSPIVLVVMAALLVLLVPARAMAHAGHSGPMQTYTQAVGPYDLAITIEIPPSVPSPLYLDIFPQSDIGGTTIELRAVPRSQSFANAPVAQVNGLSGPQGAYYTQLQVDRDGDWDLEVRASGPRGSGVARIPFRIIIPPLPIYTIPLAAAIAGLIILLLINMGLATVFNQRQQPVPRWASWLLGHGMFACLIVGGIFGLMDLNTQAQNAQAASITAPATYGLPHVNAVLRTDPAAPQAGQPLTLTMDLSDGSTGLPVEDLIPHHEALMHLVVIGADGAFFAHIHPPSTAPGRYAIALTPDRPGRYTAYMEIARQDSSTQVIARDFSVGGAAPAAAPAPPGLGPRTVDGMQVNVTSSVTPIKAGRQATLTFRFAADGQPVRDLQPWLGMAGHLIARGADGAIYGHIHALGPMAPTSPTSSGVIYGPDISFVYTFPQSGRYQLWAQFRHNDKIVTVPVLIEVE